MGLNLPFHLLGVVSGTKIEFITARTNSSGKVMFSQASVSYSVNWGWGLGEVSPVLGHFSWDRYFWSQVPSGG